MKSLFIFRSLRAFDCFFIGLMLGFSFSGNAQPGLVAHYTFNGIFFDQTANANHALPMGIDK